MRNSHHLTVLAACAMAFTPAQAETTAQKLTRIEAETAVLKATARKAEVQAQISMKRAEIAQRDAETRRTAPQAAEAPQLRGIEGVGGRLYATLELPHRGTMDVAAGDRLPDGSRVVSIRPNEVVMETAARRRISLTGNTMALAPAAAPSYVPAPMQAPPSEPPVGAAPPTSSRAPSLAQGLPALPDPRGVRK